MENGTPQPAAQKADDQLQHVKGAIESLLFVNEKPVTLDQIKGVCEGVSNAEIKKAISELQSECEGRRSGVIIVEIAGGYQMLSNPIYASYLRNFYKTKHKEKLSKPALECMAIIAYKQPVTRSDIELIRGVNSDGVVSHLLDKELIKVIGRKDVPGRPYVYGATKQFLEYFGLKSLDDLPALEEFPALQPAEESIIPAEIEDEPGDASETPETEAVNIEGDAKAQKEESLVTSEGVVEEGAQEEKQE